VSEDYRRTARLLITGDTGLLGSALSAEARQRHGVFGISRTVQTPSAEWEHRPVDLTDADATVRCLYQIRPNLIVHCAAVTDVEQCERQPEYAHDVNVEATKVLVDWAGRNGAKFVFISTDSVFDGEKGGYCESDLPRPVNQYSRTKLDAEQVVVSLCTDFLIVRTNFYGWNQTGKPNLGKWMCRKLLRGEALAAFVDVRFSPLFVNDLAKLVLELISQEASGILHVAARDSCSKYEFALLLAESFGLDARVVTPVLLEDFAFQARRPRDTSLVVGKCERLLGREMPTVRERLTSFAQAASGCCEGKSELTEIRSLGTL
jgi:dTDP-4-dehydrorhamnose reductase